MDIPLKDAMAQLKKMIRLWHRGTAVLTKLRKQVCHNQDRLMDIGLVEALDIQIKSALNILKFYDLRGQMTQLADQEAQNTRRMIQLTEQDPRLGFHSEAEGYKYYPDKLRWRLQQLQQAQQTEAYALNSGWLNMQNFRWKAERNNNSDSIRITVELKGFLNGMDEFTLALDDSGRSFPAILHADATERLFTCHKTLQCKLMRKKGRVDCAVDIDCKAYSSHRPLRLNLIRLTDLYQTRYSWPKLKAFRPPRLNMVFYQPANMGLLTEE